MKLGAIADDFTGATDLANTLVKEGMRVVQMLGVPEGTPPDVDAVVVALKSRSIPARDAVTRWVPTSRSFALHSRQRVERFIKGICLCRTNSCLIAP